MNVGQLCMGCMKERESGIVCSHCGYQEGTLPKLPQHLVPRTILNEKYIIGRVLGHGGFGITYLAWDVNLNIKLAIKEYLPQELATRAPEQTMVSAYSGNLKNQFDYGLEKFLDEARTLAQFEGHPNIISVRDFFKSNGTAYLVMNYLEGITLKEYLQEKGSTLPFDIALNIMMPVMDALRMVHDVGILHRDISPDNIFITASGLVKVLDFGAARQAIGGQKSLSVILKPGYAPEEQYRTKGIQGPWTDVYAVAATFYHVLTGHIPLEALERMEQDGLVALSQLGIVLPGYAEKALLKALSIRASNRFQTMKEFQDALSTESFQFDAIGAAPIVPNSINMAANYSKKISENFTSRLSSNAAQTNPSGSIIPIMNLNLNHQNSAATPFPSENTPPFVKPKSGNRGLLIFLSITGGIFVLLMFTLGIMYVFNNTVAHKTDTALQVATEKSNHPSNVQIAPTSAENTRPAPTPIPSQSQIPVNTNGTTIVIQAENFAMATGVDDQGKPINQVNSYAPDAPSFFVAGSISNAPENTKLTFKWIYMPVNQEFGSFDLNLSGSQFVHSYVNRGENLFPEGNYEVRILINGNPTPIKVVPFVVTANGQQSTSQASEYIIPESNIRKITAADIKGLDSWGLKLARNEIMARYGYVFKTPEIQIYFESKSWYTLDSSYNGGNLNEFEKYNVEFIKSYE